MTYRQDIDGIRALAILPVIFYHAGLPGWSGGFIGVDVFFVLSGYLITGIILRETLGQGFSLLTFYERRVRRILPALAVVIAVCFAIGWAVMLPDELKKLGESGIYAVLFASNFYFPQVLDYFEASAKFSPLLHTWSLAVEEQFYVFFPLLLIFLCKRFSQLAVFVSVAVLSLVSLFAAVALLPAKSDLVFYMFPFRAWELGLGALLAFTFIAKPANKWLCNALALSGIALIIVPTVTYSADTPFPGLSAVAPVLGTALLIWTGTRVGGTSISRFLSLPLLVWIGLISYSLYLWHWPIIAFMRIVKGGVDLSLPQSLFALFMSFALAWATYRFIETPFRRRRRGLFSTNGIFGSTIVTLGLLTVIGGVLVFQQGVKGRLTAEARALASISRDVNPLRKQCMDVLPQNGLCVVWGDLSQENNSSEEQNSGIGMVDFVFWGDSHVDAIHPAITQAAIQAGQVGLIASRRACAPVKEIARSTRSKRCIEFNRAVDEYFSNYTPAIPVLFLFARWSLYVDGGFLPHEGGDRVKLKWVGAQEPAAVVSDSNVDLFKTGFRSTLNDVSSRYERVIVLGPVPEARWDVPRLMARSNMLNIPARNSFPVDAYESRSGETERLLEELSSEFDNVSYVSLKTLFCDSEVCKTLDENGKQLYFDDDHINATSAPDLFSDLIVDRLLQL